MKAIDAQAKKKAVDYIENHRQGTVERFRYNYYSFEIVYLLNACEYTAVFSLSGDLISPRWLARQTP